MLYQAIASASVSYGTRALLLERHSKIVKKFGDESKARDTKASKEAVETISSYFKENPNAPFYIGELSISAAALKNVVGAAKELLKPIFLFNVDPSLPTKIAYLNVVPKELLKQLDGKTWAAPVGEVLKGKGGGKPDSFQGVGSEVNKEKVEEAKKVAEETFKGVFKQ